MCIEPNFFFVSCALYLVFDLVLVMISFSLIFCAATVVFVTCYSSLHLYTLTCSWHIFKMFEPVKAWQTNIWTNSIPNHQPIWKIQKRKAVPHSVPNVPSINSFRPDHPPPNPMTMSSESVIQTPRRLMVEAAQQLVALNLIDEDDRNMMTWNIELLESWEKVSLCGSVIDWLESLIGCNLIDFGIWSVVRSDHWWHVMWLTVTVWLAFI